MNKKEQSEYLVHRINQLLEEKRITLNKLSRISGVPQSTLNNIMNYGRMPAINTLYEIADGFDMCVTEFLNFPPYNKKTAQAEGQAV